MTWLSLILGFLRELFSKPLVSSEPRETSADARRDADDVRDDVAEALREIDAARGDSNGQ